MERQFPTNPAVPFLIGLALRQKLNQNIEARRAFQRASVLSTNDIMILNQLVDLDIVEKNEAPSPLPDSVDTSE